MINTKYNLLIVVTILLLTFFGLTGEASATVYNTTGTLTSTNLFSSETVTSIDSFYYNISVIPVGTTLKIQFNQDGGSTWYDAAGISGQSEDCTITGGETITLTSGWSGPNFYYKIEFTSDYTGTPILDSVKVEYTSNTAPNAPSNPSPLNEATGVSTSPTLSVDVSDTDADNMDVSFYNALDDSLIGTDAGVASGGTA